jgi:protein-disulfide isomerase
MNLTESPFAQNLRRLHTEGVPEEGPSSARVTIVEFTDFQCESCSVQAKMLDDELRQAFPGHVRLYAKDFPLKGVHDWAFQAAVAGACAYEQGNAHFWVYRRWVFDHQEEMSSSNINAKVLEFARQDRLHTQDLRACMSSSAATNAVQASIAEAQALNLSGTPTLFINGRRLDGSRRWSEIQAIIRFELDNTQAAGDAKCLCGPN